MWGGGRWASLGEGILTGSRLQRQDQDQWAYHQVQAVEGPFPVSIFLVRVHEGHREEQQELHGQLSSVQRRKGVARELSPELSFLRTWLLLTHELCAGLGYLPVAGSYCCCNTLSHPKCLQTTHLFPSGSGGQKS